MSKKLITFIMIISALLVIPTTVVYAYNKMQVIAETNDGTWVQSFTDNGNRCYVVERHNWDSGNPLEHNISNAISISCVKDK